MKKILGIMSAVFFLSIFFIGCGGGGSSSTQTSSQPSDPVKAPEYATSVTPVMSKSINASTGGIIEVTSDSSLINGIKLGIPGGALSQDTIISVGEVNNPPALPIGLNYVGVPVDFGPDGIVFSKPALLEIPFSDTAMEQAGVTSKAALKLFVFDKTKNAWSEARIIGIDTVRNVVIGQVDHFSFYSLVGLSGDPPRDLGKPQPGDILFTLSQKESLAGWVPGHNGIYTGEKKWNKEGNASADVISCGKYNVVEALWSGVQYSYYKIPNVTQSCNVENLFSGNSVYMGAREPSKFTLTPEQRIKIVEFVEQQIGKPYVKVKTYGAFFGLLEGGLVKGPDSFNCVGLVEKAYELAGANPDNQGIAQGVVKYDDGDLLTPALMYGKTKPAGGTSAIPVIKWATLTPKSGTVSTQVLAQIAVSHPDGSDRIDSVRYVTDSGYLNPNININDAGMGGDLKAGDGIYSAQAAAGGDPSKGVMGITFIVTDKSGKSVSIRLVYTYVASSGGYTEVNPQIRSQLPIGLDKWGL